MQDSSLNSFRDYSQEFYCKSFFKCCAVSHRIVLAIFQEFFLEFITVFFFKKNPVFFWISSKVSPKISSRDFFRIYSKRFVRDVSIVPYWISSRFPPRISARVSFGISSQIQSYSLDSFRRSFQNLFKVPSRISLGEFSEQLLNRIPRNFIQKVI